MEPYCWWFRIYKVLDSERDKYAVETLTYSMVHHTYEIIAISIHTGGRLTLDLNNCMEWVSWNKCLLMQDLKISTHCDRLHYSEVIMNAICVPNHRRDDCLLNCLFRCNQRKHQSSASVALVTVTGEFSAQRASNAEIVSIWWRHLERTVFLVIEQITTSERHMTMRLIQYKDVILPVQQIALWR